MIKCIMRLLRKNSVFEDVRFDRDMKSKMKWIFVIIVWME